jgi:hypothetical protein
MKWYNVPPRKYNSETYEDITSATVFWVMMCQRWPEDDARNLDVVKTLWPWRTPPRPVAPAGRSWRRRRIVTSILRLLPLSLFLQVRPHRSWLLAHERAHMRPRRSARAYRPRSAPCSWPSRWISTSRRRSARKSWWRRPDTARSWRRNRPRPLKQQLQNDAAQLVRVQHDASSAAAVTKELHSRRRRERHTSLARRRSASKQAWPARAAGEAAVAS